MRKKFEKLFKEYEKLIKKAEKGIVTEYTVALKAMYKLTADMFRKYEKNGKLTYEEMAKYKRMQGFYKELDVLVNETYKRNTKAIKDVLSETYKLNYNGVKEIVELTQNKKLIPIIREDVLKKAMYNDISGLRWTDRMGLHRETAVLKIRETVTKGLIEGQTYSTMSKELNKSLSGQVVNPMRIVRTESHRVFQEAKKDSLDGASKKVKMTKEWITSNDERVRGYKPRDKANHVDMDGIIVPYEEDFITPNGNRGFGPGMFGVPEEDCNCRCDFIIDFIDD